MIPEIHTVSWPGWETVGIIGQGSFGAVYEIQRDVFGDLEKAALKVISIPQNRSELDELYSEGFTKETVAQTYQNHLKNIVSEYSMMRKMNSCVNVVHCDDVRYEQQPDGIGWNIYIKMELLAPLTKALPADISEETAVKIGIDMCHALEACGRHDIVHRDIKPQNMFLSDNGDCKLGDFGIAKTIERTTGGTRIGTFKYMAPEVYNNQPYGSSADIYSLGLVLYWLLNERRTPFMPLPPAQMLAGMDGDAANRRLSGEPIPAPKNGSAELKRIVLKACAFNPKERYGNALEMRRDLERVGSVPVIPVIPNTLDQTETLRVRKANAPESDRESQQVSTASSDAFSAMESNASVTTYSAMEEEPKKKKHPFLIFLILLSLIGVVFAAIITVNAFRSGKFPIKASSNTEPSKSLSGTGGNSADAGTNTESPTTPDPDEKPTIQITFYSGNEPESAKDVQVDQAYGTLPAPTLPHHTFKGWYTQAEGGQQITADSIVKSQQDLTLYAQWEPKTFTVFFHPGSGTVSENKKTVTYGQCFGALPIPTRENYTFVGWYTQAEGGTKIVESSIADNSADMNLYAQWSQNTFAVTFNANSGTVSTDRMEAIVGVPLGTLPTPTREHYEFAGWYTDADSGDQVTSGTVIDEQADITLYAQWKAKTLTLYFNANGGSVSTGSKTLTYQEAYGSLPTPTRDYHKFTGWYTSASGGSKVTADTVANQSDNITLYAHWQENGVSGWVKASNVPNGAQIVNRKWSYTKTTTKESTNTSMSGYTQVDSYWVQSSSGSTNYASFPSTFDKNHNLYKTFAKSAYSGYENATSKRVVTNSWAGYIYWHWMYNVSYSNTTDRFISDRTGYFDKYGKTNNSSYYFGWFYAFTSSVNCKYLDKAYCCSRNQASYYCHNILPSDKSKIGTPRFFRFDYYTSSYVDYYKMFVYEKTENLESSSKITASGDISNVQEWVQYRVK